MVRDIDPGNRPYAGFQASNPTGFTVLGGRIYFAATSPTDGTELWKSDGTPDGTVLVKDIAPGPASSSPQFLTLFGTKLLFMAYGDQDFQLWVSDGTALGTVAIQGPTPRISFPGDLVPLGQVALFAASDPIHGTELWKTDGTNAGTSLVLDIAPGLSSSSPVLLTRVQNSVFFFRGNDNPYFIGDLWKSDGTPDGTSLIRAFFGVGYPVSRPVAIGNRLLFYQCDGTSCGVWSSDGTAAGTSLLINGYQPSLISDGTVAYVGTTDGVWRTDGTSRGTVFLGSFLTMPLAFLNGAIYFSRQSSTYPYPGQLWRSDGTPQGTSLVAEFASQRFATKITPVGNRLFLLVTDGLHYELWTSDGTSPGTSFVKVLFDGNGIYPVLEGPDGLTDFDGTLILASDDGRFGREVWKSDGTPTGTGMLKEINPEPISSTPFWLTADFIGNVEFSADDGEHGRELWTSDGTLNGTLLLKDIQVPISGATSDSSPEYLTPLSGLTLFSAFDQQHGRELWRTDGTSTGTELVKDINPSPGAWSGPQGLTRWGNQVYFRAYDGTSSSVWKSDGTEGGTEPLVPGLSPFPPFVELGGYLFFLGSDGSRFGLWKTDGTSSGTALVKSLNPSSQNNDYPRSLTRSGSTLYFSAYDGSTYYQLWKSDGTSSGTQTIPSIPSSYIPAWSLTDVRGILFFGLGDSSGRDLWRTDGTVSGPARLTSCSGCRYPREPGYLTHVAGTLFFTAFDGASGYELWKSDGTPQGTVLVKDIRPGPDGSWPQSLFAVGRRLYFAASDGEHGLELWQSDGTAAGTSMVQDINPGPASSIPWGYVNWTLSGSRLFFVASDGVHGYELWSLPVDTATPPASFFTLTPCRLVDTRGAQSPSAGPALFAGTDRKFVVAGSCGIPPTATSISLNVVAVQPTDGPGFFTAYPGSVIRPLAATINYSSGQIRANNAILALGAAGDIQVFCGQGSGTADLVIDVNGYFQ